MGLLFLEHGEAAQKGQARVDERRKLAGEDREVFRLHAAADLAGGFCLGLALGFCRDGSLGFFATFALFLNLGRIKPIAAQLLAEQPLPGRHRDSLDWREFRRLLDPSSL